MADDNDNEEKQLRSVLLQTANTILLARQRAEEELIQAKEALERKTEELAHSLAMMRATLESTTDGILVTDAQRQRHRVSTRTSWTCGNCPVSPWRTMQHRQLLEITSRQFKEPEKFCARIEEIYVVFAAGKF